LGNPIDEALSKSNFIASISVQAAGTQTSFPDTKDSRLKGYI